MAGILIVPVAPIDAQNQVGIERLLQQGRAVVVIERSVQLPVDEVLFEHHRFGDKRTPNLVEQGYRMGSIAAAMLLERIDGLEAPPRSVNLTLNAEANAAKVSESQRAKLISPALASRSPTQTADEILDILAMRQVLEVGFLPAVVSAIEDHHLRTLRGLVERMEQRAAEGSSFAAEDRLFHQTLYAPLHNPSLLSLIGRFWDLFANLDERNFRHTESATDTVRHHSNILNAVERRDVALAQFHMNAHFYDVVNVVKEGSKASQPCPAVVKPAWCQA